MNTNALETICSTCGEIGTALSTCKKCGEFLSITIMLAGKESEVCQHESGFRTQEYDSDGCGYYLWHCDSCDYTEIDGMA